MLSAKAKLAHDALKTMGYKESLDFINPPRIRRNKLPKFLLKLYEVAEKHLDGCRYFTVGPSCERHVVFFHGGGYAFEAAIGHFLWMKRILETYRCQITFIEYPLAPENEATRTFDVAIKLYERLVAENPDQVFTLMGDSAGGGLALAVAVEIKQRGLKQPVSNILISPWLDVSLSNPEIPALAERDVVLDIEKTREIGAVYSRVLGKAHYKVSPIYGDLNGLGDILVLYTSEEILKPDCLKLIEAADLIGTRIKGIEFKNLWHDFILWPIPERDEALALLCAYL